MAKTSKSKTDSLFFMDKDNIRFSNPYFERTPIPLKENLCSSLPSDKCGAGCHRN